MNTQQIHQTLAELRFSAGLSDGDQWKLAKIAHSTEFPTGATIFTEGQRPRELFLLCRGRVELRMNVPAQGCLPILTLEEGDLLGWSAAVDQSELTATAVALQDTAAIALSVDKLKVLCEEDHDIGYEIMRRVALALSRRLVATRLQLLDLFANSTSHVPDKQVEAPQ